MSIAASLRTQMNRFKMLGNVALLLTMVAAAPSAQAQSNDTFRSMNQPVAPFRIIGNVYYVGASDIASYLIVTPQGHLLIEGGFEETAPQIEKNIATLGFKLEDVKILLSSHAHLDHAGGLTELKRLTGAKLVASAADAELLARGGRGDFQYGDQLPFPPVKVDRVVGDKDEIQLGGVTIVARLTPGHTKGNLTWTTTVTEGGKTYNVVVMGSVTHYKYPLVDNANYPEIAADLTRSFEMLKILPCDVFLAPHGYVFSLKEKMGRLNANAAENPFIDPQGYRKAVEDGERAFQNDLESERRVILRAPPVHPDKASKYLIYLHGAIVEGSDGQPVSNQYGAYEYQKIATYPPTLSTPHGFQIPDPFREHLAEVQSRSRG